MQIKNKKNLKKAKVVKIERDPNDWQQLILEAKKKESRWKSIRDENGEEVMDEEM